jgi:hypothetical protein
MKFKDSLVNDFGKTVVFYTNGLGSNILQNVPKRDYVPKYAVKEEWKYKKNLKGNHAWNVIILKNKQRKLYCDATWYQGNNIDDEGYVVDIPDKNPVNLTFNIDEFNSLGGAIDTATGKLLEVHFAWADARIQN